MIIIWVEVTVRRVKTSRSRFKSLDWKMVGLGFSIGGRRMIVEENRYF